MLEEILKRHGSDKASEEHNYAPMYEKFFEKFRYDKDISLLEIGIGGYEHPDRGGQSLRAWKEYFEFAAIHGVDIYDKSGLEEFRIFTHKCSQVDEIGLEQVLEYTGTPSIIIDDGSHHSDDVIGTFNILWPRLKSGGIYAIEDLHASYWCDISVTGEDFKGGVHPDTSMNYLKELTDTINHEASSRFFYRDMGIKTMTFSKFLLIIEKE